MTPSMREAIGADRRARVLRALGMTPWVRRALPDAVRTVLEPDGRMHAASAAGTACMVVLPQGCSTRELDLLGRALNACGATIARAGRLTVNDGQLTNDVPEARAYLVFGEAQAHALGRALSATAMHRAQIVLADEPSLILTSAGAKRRLWTALRNVRRALAVMEH